MDRTSKKRFTICKRFVKYLNPLLRIRKFCRKNNMRQLKIAIGILGVASCFVTLLLYYWHRSFTNTNHSVIRIQNKEMTLGSLEDYGTPMRHVPLDEIYKDTLDKNKPLTPDEAMDGMFKAYFVDTPGCQIPITMLNFYQSINKNKTAWCGLRAVFLKKTGNKKVQVLIKMNKMKKLLNKTKTVNYYCCSRFIKPLLSDNHTVKYTPCKKVESGDVIPLETDFVNIQCFDTRNTKEAIYDDAYAFIKKKNVPPRTVCSKDHYNVLMLGMDSMSLSRVVLTMPRTSKFFLENYWLGLRGYHKVGDNTFPNLMAALTGKNVSTIHKKCAKQMDACNDLLIWSQFRKAGYVTAYGEDHLRLPDTFSNNFAFEKFPTDHFMRPFFKKREYELDNTVCAGKEPSGKQLLDYAYDFALTYRNEAFFGVFWMNSFSHNIRSRSENADKIFENFFNRLTYTGILDNTFVIFFSDHGVRFGPHRMKMESYYDERLPMLFMFAPLHFKSTQIQKLKSSATNQYRLLTPYDLYNTLVEILDLSVCGDVEIPVSQGCPFCHSMFKEVNVNRTCTDASIHQKWCSCHKLFPLEVKDNEGIKSVMHMVLHIQRLIKAVKTKPCWGCMDLALKNIVRIHFYFDKPKSALYHVVAFTMHPGNVSYEATVRRKGGEVELVGPISVITSYKGKGECTINKKDRLFCVCQKIENCTESRKSVVKKDHL